MERALAAFGQPISTDPEQALLDMVSEAAGNVHFLRGIVAELSEDPEPCVRQDRYCTTHQSEWALDDDLCDRLQRTVATGWTPRGGRWASLTGYSRGSGLFGPVVSIDKEGGEHVTGEEYRAATRLYGEWTDRLVKYAKAAVAAGIAKRQVELAEQHGEQIVVVFVNALNRLNLDPKQMLEARAALAQELRVLDAEEVTVR